MGNDFELKEKKMKQMVEKTIDINELNGELITKWISKLLDLQKQHGVCSTISVEGDDYGYGGCNIEFNFKRLETDEEYKNRIERETYLKQKQIEKDKQYARQLKIKKQYTEKKAELEALELELAKSVLK